MPGPDSPLHLPQAPASASQGAPLQGMTLLAVEDSRSASDMLRLMCQRSGARLRRAESLEVARSHLRCYRPDAVLVDIGLPDGDGTLLIRDLAARRDRPAVLAMSGDPDLAQAALASGATAFLAKPIGPLAVFQRQVLLAVTGTTALPLPVPAEDGAPARLDPLALHDDLLHAAALLSCARDDRRTNFIAGFVEGVARMSQDGEMARIAHAARLSGVTGQEALRRILADRLAVPLGDLIAPPPPEAGQPAAAQSA